MKRQRLARSRNVFGNDEAREYAKAAVVFARIPHRVVMRGNDDRRGALVL
jgi:hypothetical protein